MWVDFDLVGGFQEVLSDGRHRHLSVHLRDTEIAGAVQPEEAFHGTEALFHSKASFRDKLVEPLLGGAQGAISSSFAHDPITVMAPKKVTVLAVGIRFVSQHPLRLCTLDHGAKLRAFGAVGRRGVDLVNKAFLVGAGEGLVAKRAL